MTEGIAGASAIVPPMPVVPGRVGILGGTFDPIHHGHLAIAEEAREALGLERVVFIPAAQPPHKLGLRISPASDRLAMVELSIADNPWFVASRMELDRTGPSYTVDTVAALAEEARAAGRVPDLVFIMSGETLSELPRWREPERILDLCRVAVVPRGGSETPGPGWISAHFPGREGRILLLPGPLLAVSGSVVRARAAAGRSVRYLVPDAVARHIVDHALYTQASPDPA